LYREESGEYDNLENGYDINSRRHNGKDMLDENNGVQDEETCPIKWLENFCNTDVNNCNLHIFEKIWIVIARCDGGSGQLLGICMCMYVYVYMYIFMYVYVYIYIYI
jgi:hypothetical protein